MVLAKEVKQYYIEHFSELDEDKRFHFVTRLYGWNRDEQAKQILERMESSFVGDPSSIQRTLSDLLRHPPEAKINAITERQPYFDKYPELRGRIFALFRARHLRDVYGVDVREELLSVVSMAELERMADELSSDHSAVRTLSTYAINYLYLVRQILFGTPQSMSDFLRSIEKIASGYDRTSPTDVQLLIYLYTHCIIGASNFYLQPVPANHKDDYVRMVEELEPLIDAMFDHINLDNKFEYLVCCRILGYKTQLFERVFEEASRSVSPEGTFVIDTHNDNRQGTKTSLSDSEHRNVLFIMSTLPYHSA